MARTRPVTRSTTARSTTITMPASGSGSASTSSSAALTASEATTAAQPLKSILKSPSDSSTSFQNGPSSSLQSTLSATNPNKPTKRERKRIRNAENQRIRQNSALSSARHDLTNARVSKPSRLPSTSKDLSVRLMRRRNKQKHNQLFGGSMSTLANALPGLDDDGIFGMANIVTNTNAKSNKNKNKDKKNGEGTDHEMLDSNTAEESHETRLGKEAFQARREALAKRERTPKTTSGRGVQKRRARVAKTERKQFLGNLGIALKGTENLALDEAHYAGHATGTDAGTDAVTGTSASASTSPRKGKGKSFGTGPNGISPGARDTYTTQTASSSSSSAPAAPKTTRANKKLNKVDKEAGQANTTTKANLGEGTTLDVDMNPQSQSQSQDENMNPQHQNRYQTQNQTAVANVNGKPSEKQNWWSSLRTHIQSQMQT